MKRLAEAFIWLGGLVLWLAVCMVDWAFGRERKDQ